MDTHFERVASRVQRDCHISRWVEEKWVNCRTKCHSMRFTERQIRLTRRVAYTNRAAHKYRRTIQRGPFCSSTKICSRGVSDAKTRAEYFLAFETPPRHSLTTLEPNHSRPLRTTRAHRVFYQGRREELSARRTSEVLVFTSADHSFARRCRARGITYDSHLSFFLGLAESAPRVGTSVLSAFPVHKSAANCSCTLSLKRRV